MKVICVETKWLPALGFENVGRPNFGDTDTVISEGVLMGSNTPCYTLERFPDIGIAKKCFIPLSSIDENEMQRDYQRPAHVGEI